MVIWLYNDALGYARLLVQYEGLGQVRTLGIIGKKEAGAF